MATPTVAVGTAHTDCNSYSKSDHFGKANHPGSWSEMQQRIVLNGFRGNIKIYSCKDLLSMLHKLLLAH